MPKSTKITLSALLLALLLSYWGYVGLAKAYEPAQTSVTPIVTLLVSQEQAVEGEAIHWMAVITPSPGTVLTEVTLESVNPQVWHIAGQPPVTVMAITPLAVTAVPLASGDLWPGLLLRYRLDGAQHILSIVADHPIHVTKAEALFEVNLLQPAKAARVGEMMTMTLLLHNGTPFTLTNTQIEGAGTGLAWALPLSLENDLLPGESTNFFLRAKVQSRDALPIVRVTTTWQAASITGQRVTHEIVGREFDISQDFWAGVPKDILAIFLGIMASVITTAVTRIIEGRFKEHDQQRLHWERLHSLLKLTVLSAKYAEKHAMPIALEPLTAVFEQEGIFAMAQKLDLISPAEDLWDAAQNHNDGLAAPSASRRVEGLQTAIKDLEAQMKRAQRTAQKQGLEGHRLKVA